jgi:DNA-binding MarR family transcriptional regulator
MNEKEFAVIKEIESSYFPDQRDIATKTGISLGLTNLIIKRLIKKGYIKAKQLNRRKIHYILTPKGFKEKAKKSYNFVVKTIEMVGLIKNKIQELIVQQVKDGATNFVIIGNNELADIAEIVFKNLNIYYLRYKNVIKNNSTIIEYTKSNIKTRVNLLDFLSASGLFL